MQVRTLKQAASYLECGRLLTEAKSECLHGEWLPTLASHGVSERTAQRMMTLHRAGMSAETLAALGVRGALASIVRPREPASVSDLPNKEGGQQ